VFRPRRRDGSDSHRLRKQGRRPHHLAPGKYLRCDGHNDPTTAGSITGTVGLVGHPAVDQKPSDMNAAPACVKRTLHR